MTHVVDIGDYVIAKRKTATTARVTDIVTIASQLSAIAARDIIGRYRFPEIVRVRQACYLVAREAGHSYPRIAHLMGREHATVHYGAKMAVKRCQADGEFADMLDELRDRVRCAAPFVARTAA